MLAARTAQRPNSVCFACCRVYGRTAQPAGSAPGVCASRGPWVWVSCRDFFPRGVELGCARALWSTVDPMAMPTHIRASHLCVIPRERPHALSLSGFSEPHQRGVPLPQAIHVSEKRAKTESEKRDPTRGPGWIAVPAGGIHREGKPPPESSKPAARAWLALPAPAQPARVAARQRARQASWRRACA